MASGFSVTPLDALSDNYMYLIMDKSTMQAAVVDLWALASAYKLLRSGQSTFGQLAAAIHTRPEEVVVRDTNESGCPAFAAMYPNQLPAFCSPHHGKSRLKSCGCRATP